MLTKDRRLLEEVSYRRAADKYERSLKLENIMESTAQARQREITVESFALLRAHRPDVYYFNELLVQYRLGRSRKIHGVVPDNMVVLSTEPVEATGSYIIAHQPVAPFWVLEYVSKHNQRKDYEVNLQRYEKQLQVPYYLIFYPDNQDLTLYRLQELRYSSVKPNAAGRVPLPELDLEMAILDGWVRYWLRGELLRLPAELDRARQDADQRAATAEQARQDADQRAATAEAELARLRAELALLRPPGNR